MALLAFTCNGDAGGGDGMVVMVTVLDKKTTKNHQGEGGSRLTSNKQDKQHLHALSGRTDLSSPSAEASCTRPNTT